jgi:hypothetical protein
MATQGPKKSKNHDSLFFGLKKTKGLFQQTPLPNKFARARYHMGESAAISQTD